MKRNCLSTRPPEAIQTLQKSKRVCACVTQSCHRNAEVIATSQAISAVPRRSRPSSTRRRAGDTAELLHEAGGETEPRPPGNRFG